DSSAPSWDMRSEAKHGIHCKADLHHEEELLEEREPNLQRKSDYTKIHGHIRTRQESHPHRVQDQNKTERPRAKATRGVRHSTPSRQAMQNSNTCSERRSAANGLNIAIGKPDLTAVYDARGFSGVIWPRHQDRERVVQIKRIARWMSANRDGSSGLQLFLQAHPAQRVVG